MASKEKLEYDRWRLWWYAALYGASPVKRMQVMDEFKEKYGKEIR